MVSEVCDEVYDAGRVREGSVRGEERLVGCSDSGAAVGMAEENPLTQPIEWIQLGDRPARNGARGSKGGGRVRQMARNAVKSIRLPKDYCLYLP